MKKIEFTDDQFKHLLELAYLGDWVANGHRLSDDKLEKYEEIFHYLFAHAADYGLQDCCIPYDPSDPDSRVYPTADFEEEMNEYTDEYDENVFWNELASRLAHRDFLNQFGEKKILEMKPDERFTRLMRLDDHYQEILAEKGIMTLKIEYNESRRTNSAPQRTQHKNRRTRRAKESLGPVDYASHVR